MTQVPLIWHGTGVHGVTEENKYHYISWNRRICGNTRIIIIHRSLYLYRFHSVRIVLKSLTRPISIKIL